MARSLFLILFVVILILNRLDTMICAQKKIECCIKYCMPSDDQDCKEMKEVATAIATLQGDIVTENEFKTNEQGATCYTAPKRENHNRTFDLDCDDVCKCLHTSDCNSWRNNSVGSATSGASLERKDYRTYCDCSNETEGAWMVIQRRLDGSVDFNRSWADYAVGFGRTDSDFWMGLDAISKLTENGQWKLRINLESFEGNKTAIDLQKFQVGNSSTNYTLMIDGSTGLGNVFTLSGHNGAQFSTLDYNIAKHPKGSLKASPITNCAQYHGGGWWFTSIKTDSTNCFSVNLNGKFNATKQCNITEPHYRNGIIWSLWPSSIGDACTPLKSSEMKIQLSTNP